MIKKIISGAFLTAFTLSFATLHAAENKCPMDMVNVSGEYCPEVEQVCLKWLDENLSSDANSGIGPLRCAEFKFPIVCKSKKLIHKDFCIDKYEWPNKKGELPQVLMTWWQAKKSCESVGKRLCTGSEHTFACEGNSIKPYPYGDGYHRGVGVCNQDRQPWLDPATHTFEELDKRVPSGQYETCISDFGVYDIVGNADEWVVNESGKPYISALSGGHSVAGVRNRCRPKTIVHGPEFAYYVTGTRCCSDIK